MGGEGQRGVDDRAAIDGLDAVYVRGARQRPDALLLALLGAINTAVPFFLIAWGQQYIDSGLASIFNASAPLFTALFALGYDRSQRSTGLRLVGILVGFTNQ